MPLSSSVIALGHSLRPVNFIEAHCYGRDLNSVCYISKLFSIDNTCSLDNLFTLDNTFTLDNKFSPDNTFI